MKGYEELVHSRVLEVLESVGLRIYQEGVLRRLGSAGARVDLENLNVKFDKALTAEALSWIPRDTALWDWDGNRITGDGTRFMSSGTGVAVIDPRDGRRRDTNRADVRQMICVQEALENIFITGGVVDAPEFGASSALVDTFEVLCHSRKHSGLGGRSPKEIDSIIDMSARRAGGLDLLKARPPLHFTLCPKSPLSISDHNLDSTLQAASHGFPICIMTMSMGGGTAPVSFLGQVILTAAEIVGGFVMLQLLYPGTPVIASSVSSALDMKTAILSLGAPERPMQGTAIAAMARYYGVLSIIGGLSSDAKDIDVQGGFEKALTALPLMNEADFVMGAGALDSANTYSFEQLIIDNEFAGAILAHSRKIDASTVEEDVVIIKSMGFSGDYLPHEHTFRNFRNYWRPSFFERLSYSAWSKEPRTVRESVEERLVSLLARPIRPVVDERTLEEMVRTVREFVGPDFSYENLSGGAGKGKG